VIDKIFDFLNSKSIFSKGVKASLSMKNIETLKEVIIPLIHYLYKLKFDRKFLYKSDKKTFIKGFAVAIKSMFSIAQSIFSNYGEMKFSYILTYKFSQNHLEIFFGKIRQRFGCNNNPNVMQFITAMKKLFLKNFIKCKNNSNCNVFDDDLVGVIFDFKWSRCKVVNYENQTLDDDVSQRALLLNSTNSDLNEAKNNILYYILGYIVRKMINILNCGSCIQNLFETTFDHSYPHKSTYSRFVDFKNRGGFISGLDRAFKVIIEAEKMFLILTNNLKKQCTKFRYFNHRYTNVLKNFLWIKLFFHTSTVRILL